MSRVEAAAADRLPWLSDEPQPTRAKRRGGALLGWSATALVAVAGAGFWIGIRSVQDQPAHVTPHSTSTATVALPAPRPVEPEVRMPTQMQVKPSPAAQVHPAPVREVKITLTPAPKPVRRETEKAAAVPEEQAQAEAALAAVQPKAQVAVPKAWNPRIFAGAAGRVVQVGAFGSIEQAKLGWRYMARAYPAVAHLPAVVRPTRNSKGRAFYRFQVGTTSQAHSEVLCQRMQKIRFSCAVVGLPWKAKVER
jgi:hypothetical protein